MKRTRYAMLITNLLGCYLVIFTASVPTVQ